LELRNSAWTHKKKILSSFNNYFELLITVLFVLLWVLLVLLKKLPIIMPDRNSSQFVFHHYIEPLLVAFLIQIAVSIIIQHRKKVKISLESKKTIITLLYLPFIVITVFLHVNFKSWTPFIHPITYDLLYSKIDSFFPFAGWLSFLGPYFDFWNIASYLYHRLFVLMFFLSFIIHSAFDTLNKFRKVVVGTCLILLLGSVSYWIMPAIGPFIIAPPQLSDFIPYQKHMYSLYSTFVATGIVPSGYFSNAPAAMPSLHVANSLFFLIMAKRSFPILAVFYAFLFTFIVVVAVASGWHYFIDLVAGTILSLSIMPIIDRVYCDSKSLSHH